MSFQFAVITIMPDIFEALQYGVIGRALQRNIANIRCFNPRDWSTLSARRVDDKPYGGGPGMVMAYEPLRGAINYAKTQLPSSCKTIYLSPQGKTVDQALLKRVATEETSILFLAGRYEGIDERIISQYVDEEWSLGDFVISGGELAAAVCMDAIIRLLPDALGHEDSAEEDSFANGLLEHPQYTRPAKIDGLTVPEVLLNGNHRDIEQWRRKWSLGNTFKKRPELLNKQNLSQEDKALLNAFKKEQGIPLEE